MTPAEALDIVCARNPVPAARYRQLCDEHNPDVRQRDSYRREMIRLAAEPEPSYPPLTQQLRTAAGAATRAVTAAVTGQPVLVSAEERDRRQAICDACPEYDAAARRCRKCGCGGLKLSLATERCPLPEPKW
jgi:hypothetical protein